MSIAEGKITLRSVAQLGSKPKDSFLWDPSLRGFGVKVTPAGNKVFVIQYRFGRQAGIPRRLTIGKDGVWDAVRARLEAERLLRLVAMGIDPIEDAREKTTAAEVARSKARDLEFST